jgi:hypothetical protein
MQMKSSIRSIAFFLITVAMLTGMAALLATASGRAADASPVFVTKMPDGYRDWRLISVAHEAGALNSFSGVLGNDVAIKAYRDKKLPFPDGAMIAASHWRFVPSEANNKVFGQPQSFVPGAQTNVQFMIKDSKKYAATGGWGFGHFNPDGTLGAALMQTCSPCHAKASGDGVFTQYAP